MGDTLATGVPLGRQAMPLHKIHETDVGVLCCTDSVIDWWDSFGNCDMLQKAKEIARLQYRSTEVGLSRALGYATGFVTPLDDRARSSGRSRRAFARP